MWYILAPLMKVSECWKKFCNIPVPKLECSTQVTNQLLSRSCGPLKGYSLYCSSSLSQPIWMYSGLHSRCVWHPWSAHSTGIHLDTTDHCQECVLWLFQHLQIHSVFDTWVQSHGNACWCHHCVPVTMETDGQLPDTWDLWWGKCESLLIFIKFPPFASDWLNDWLV